MPYAIVQHSAFGYSGNPQFEKALELRSVTTATDINKVNKAQGILFDTYGEADDFCMTAMYPEGAAGLIAHARGTFSDLEIDGLRIYVPVRETRVVG